MKNHAYKFSIGIFLLSIAAGAARVNSQNSASEILSSFGSAHLDQCREQEPKVKKTYDFRSPKNPIMKPYGRSRFDSFKKLMPFWTSMEGKQKKGEKGTAYEEIQFLLNTYGRLPPIGESARSKKIRDDAEEKLLKLPQEEGEKKWREWLSLNPNASVEDRGKAEIRTKGLNIAKALKFDWRDHGVDMGQVGMQGNCSNCWAFATVDAMQAARQVAAIRSQNSDWYRWNLPSARQLLSCMVPQDGYCEKNWHSEAFTFMVDKGLPLGGEYRYLDNASAWGCDATHFVKALTWDYVLPATPQKVAPVEAIKHSIVLYGPVVTTIRIDSCFWLYGSGVFNEQQNEDGGHLILIVGWDDAKGAWLIKNSFGWDWGENGFGWVKYGSNNIGQWSAWIAPDPKEEVRLAAELSQERK